MSHTCSFFTQPDIRPHFSLNLLPNNGSNVLSPCSCFKDIFHSPSVGQFLRHRHLAQTQTMNKLPFRVTLLYWLVLTLIAWNGLRLWTALAWRDALDEFSAQPIPAIIAISGAIWMVTGVIHSLEHLAEKSLGGETARWGMRQATPSGIGASGSSGKIRIQIGCSLL